MKNVNFGVEFEFLVPKGYSFEEFSGILRFMAPKNMPLKLYGNTRHFNIHEDYSVGSRDCAGMEISTPILSGKRGLKMVENLLELLNSLGCTVNKSCGLHVHVDSSKVSNQEKVAILSRYADNENTIDKFVAANRRANKNEFARSMANIFDHFDPNDNEYDGFDTYDKYYKVYIHDCFPTVEFRHHEGTLDPKKVLNWIEFCINFHQQSIRLYKKSKKDYSSYVNDAEYHNPCYGLDRYKVRYFNGLKKKKAA